MVSNRLADPFLTEATAPGPTAPANKMDLIADAPAWLITHRSSAETSHGHKAKTLHERRPAVAVDEQVKIQVSLANFSASKQDSWHTTFSTNTLA